MGETALRKYAQKLCSFGQNVAVLLPKDLTSKGRLRWQRKNAK